MVSVGIDTRPRITLGEACRRITNLVQEMDSMLRDADTSANDATSELRAQEEAIREAECPLILHLCMSIQDCVNDSCRDGGFWMSAVMSHLFSYCPAINPIKEPDATMDCPAGSGNAAPCRQVRCEGGN